MIIVRTIKELQSIVEQTKKEGKTIGFVPTMGALHKGHLSLVEIALQQTNYCVSSVFVNPTQFNNADDLRNYPRMLEIDADMLKKAGCSLLFAPNEKEMYPEPDTRKFDFGQLETVMEGKHRPGHFNGVAQIVSKLFAAVQPHKAFFGQKDFQQLAIVRAMTRQLFPDIEIIGCPIVRESDGLAMSSRNMLLSPEHRQAAIDISQALFESKKNYPQQTVVQVCNAVEEKIQQNKLLKLEYFEIVNSHTLQPIAKWEDATDVTACIAVFAGKVRLIDNIVLK